MTKLEILLVSIAGFIILTVMSILSYNLGVSDAEIKQEILETHIENGNDNSIKFVWNDDEESIPKDGSLIRIEMTDENTVYLQPVE